MSYQEKYLKYKSKYLNLKAEIHNNNLENRLEQNGGNIDILNVDQLSGTASITEKKYLMLGGGNESDLNLPNKLTETPVSESENNSSSEEKPKETPVEKSKETPVEKPKEKPDKLDVDSVDSSSEHEDDHKDNNDSSSEEHKDDESHESESPSSTSLSDSPSEEVKQKGGRKEEKKNKKSSWFSDSDLVSTDTTFMSFSTLATSSESDL